jgi:hypothetical protein
MVSVVLILVAVNLLGYLIMYLLLRQRIRRAASPAAQSAELRDEVSRLIIELNQTTDRSIALLEEKISTLADLLSRADKKIQLLKRESEKHDVGSRVYGRILDGRPPLEESGRDRTEETAPAAPAVGAARGAGAAPARKEEGPADVREQVLQLYRAGFSASLISARVGAPKGEVDLIIALSERRGLS